MHCAISQLTPAAIQSDRSNGQSQRISEVALRQANAKFESRFRCMESFARDRGLVLEQLDLNSWEALWQEAKIAEKAVKTAAKTA